ncbi:MAG: cytochrome c biogenesis CcdA family protein [Christensenellales bacterium]|nr:cytochrome c biogenesis CcdA family protein [Christensenellales bacterium]
MQYLISFLEGIITFISPCLLPMLPVYVSYFAGGKQEDSGRTRTNALGFVLGFTIVFVSMGALAGTLGGFLKSHQTAVNIVSGLIVILFGLSFLEIFQLPLFRGVHLVLRRRITGFFSAVLFGLVFSIGWTPCVGTFLGSALILASQQGHTLTGTLMLLCYSLGLGLPFLASALLITRLKSTFDFLKRNYRVINIISGSLLIIVGLSMSTGLFGRLLTFLS